MLPGEVSALVVSLAKRRWQCSASVAVPAVQLTEWAEIVARHYSGPGVLIVVRAGVLIP